MKMFVNMSFFFLCRAWFTFRGQGHREFYTECRGEGHGRVKDLKEKEGMRGHKSWRQRERAHKGNTE